MNDEYIQHLRHQRAHEAYLMGAEPIVREMVRVRLMFTRPWMAYNEAGIFVASGETWTDPEAEKLYAQYQATLGLLAESCAHEARK